MSNIYELLINVVKNSKKKVLTGLDQKVKGYVLDSLYAICDSPGEKTNSDPSC